MIRLNVWYLLEPNTITDFTADFITLYQDLTNDKSTLYTEADVVKYFNNQGVDINNSKLIKFKYINNIITIYYRTKYNEYYFKEPVVEYKKKVNNMIDNTNNNQFDIINTYIETNLKAIDLMHYTETSKIRANSKAGSLLKDYIKYANSVRSLQNNINKLLPDNLVSDDLLTNEEITNINNIDIKCSKYTNYVCTNATEAKQLLVMADTFNDKLNILKSKLIVDQDLSIHKIDLN